MKSLSCSGARAFLLWALEGALEESSFAQQDQASMGSSVPPKMVGNCYWSTLHPETGINPAEVSSGEGRPRGGASISGGSRS